MVDRMLKFDYKLLLLFYSLAFSRSAFGGNPVWLTGGWNLITHFSSCAIILLIPCLFTFSSHLHLVLSCAEEGAVAKLLMFSSDLLLVSSARLILESRHWCVQHKPYSSITDGERETLWFVQYKTYSLAHVFICSL